MCPLDHNHLSEFFQQGIYISHVFPICKFNLTYCPSDIFLTSSFRNLFDLRRPPLGFDKSTSTIPDLHPKTWRPLPRDSRVSGNKRGLLYLVSFLLELDIDPMNCGEATSIHLIEYADAVWSLSDMYVNYADTICCTIGTLR